jgi:ATP-dependent Clp protease protease subunit
MKNFKSNNDQDNDQNNFEEDDYGQEENVSSVRKVIRHQEGTRYSMKVKVDIDPKVRITTDYLRMPQVVQVRGDFTDEMAEVFSNAFNAAENTGQEIIPIVIDSFGGDVYALMSMIDTIAASSVPVATIALGKAMSCGSVLLSCGAPGLRFAAPSSTMMIHAARESGISGNHDEVRVSANELMRLDKQLLQLMSTNCGHSKDYFQKIMDTKKNTDWFVHPKDAQKHNLVNHIRIPEFLVTVKMSVEFK